MSRWDDEQKMIADAVKTFPVRFGMMGFPGELFRLAPTSSHFVSDGKVQLVVQIWCSPEKRVKWQMQEWADFGRNTPECIRQSLIGVK